VQRILSSATRRETLGKHLKGNRRGGELKILCTIAGPVVVDLKGFTITSDVADSKACVVISGGTGTYPTTARNGTITMFANGINTSLCPMSRSPTLFLIRMKRVSFSANS
jgi:hypothetical protein